MGRIYLSCLLNKGAKSTSVYMCNIYCMYNIIHHYLQVIYSLYTTYTYTHSYSLTQLLTGQTGTGVKTPNSGSEKRSFTSTLRPSGVSVGMPSIPSISTPTIPLATYLTDILTIYGNSKVQEKWEESIQHLVTTLNIHISSLDEFAHELEYQVPIIGRCY